MTESLSSFSYGFALFLSLASLAVYLSGAIWHRISRGTVAGFRLDFTLGIPSVRNKESLFAYSLVASGTSLSTVMVFFLTSGSKYGWWLFLCPFMFAFGNWLMFKVYTTALAQGSLDEEADTPGVAGLIPYIGQRVSGSRRIGWLLVLLSVINLLAVLVLELIVGVEIISYLTHNTFGTEGGHLFDFFLFLVAIGLLMAYVVVGGFRAVLSSDIWQFNAIKWAFILALGGVLYLAFAEGTLDRGLVEISKLSLAHPWEVFCFVVALGVANIFLPSSQEASWQRFRAFREQADFSIRGALIQSIGNALFLWSVLILLALGLLVVAQGNAAGQLDNLSGVLGFLRTLNDSFFPFFIFPVISLAAVSALFSTADTCIAALLFLLEYTRASRQVAPPKRKILGLPPDYLISLLFILLFAVGSYLFVRWMFRPTILQLIFSVWSNLVVIAPTVISAALLGPARPEEAKRRSKYIFLSLTAGFGFYWMPALAALILEGDYLWLNQISIAIGLVASVIPLIPLWLQRSKPARA